MGQISVEKSPNPGSDLSGNQQTLRRLLIMGATAVVQHFGRRNPTSGSWLAQMLSRKPRMLVIVALANKMARIVWAMMTTGSNYRASAGAA